jgi:hypothetical protein
MEFRNLPCSSLAMRKTHQRHHTKGRSHTPRLLRHVSYTSLRPQHALYEGKQPGLLCFNPILFYLSRLLAIKAFRDYSTLEALLRIVPPNGEMMKLHWKTELLNTPFFLSDSTEKIESAASLSKRNQSVGLRAGMAVPVRNHDFRREGLYKMGTLLISFSNHIDADWDGLETSLLVRLRFSPTLGRVILL